MADWRNEISGQVTGPVVQAHSISGDVTVTMAPAQDQEMPPLTSWDDLPALPPTLRDLLEAQLKATELLPYRLLGVQQPKLTEVYVHQHVRTTQADRSTESDRKPAQDERAARTLTVTEALNGNGHLLITGDPGSGKSTVGYMYVREIAARWLFDDRPGRPPLAEPVLPLRIPARALAENKAWADLLTAGTEEILGRLLSLRPKPEVFARRALGARWLIFVDGLDEITEPETRAQVIVAIAHQIHRNADQRLVITTRQLTEADLQPLERAGVETCVIQPFGAPELIKFADRWFQAQFPLDSASHAERFISQVRDSRLRDLVRNPLLATIAAIAKTLEPERPLPNSRVSLYERFMTYLLNDHPRRREPLVELRQSLRAAPERLALVEWAHQHRTEIIEHIAARRMDAESLLTAATDWVLARQETLPDSWRSDLAEVLAGTGVLTRTEKDLDFGHHSFAEFLAARHSARAIPPEFPELDEWIERGLSAATREYALFTIVLWGENNDLGHVLRPLLAGTKEKVLFAGRLLAEDIDVAPDLTASVVERLVDLLLANGVRDDPWDDLEEIGNVLGGLSAETAGSSALAKLHIMRDAPDLAEAVRIECAVTLGKLGTPDETAEWLTRFAEDAGLKAVKRSASALVELPDGKTRAEQVLTRVAERQDDYSKIMVVAQLMLEHKMTAAASRLVSRLCMSVRTDPSTRKGADLPLPPVATRIADAFDDGPAGWGALADLAARTGRADDANWAISMALATPHLKAEDFGLAAAAAASCDLAADILSAAERHSPEHLSEAAQKVHEHGYQGLAVDLARRALARPEIDRFDFSDAAKVLIDCDAQAELLHVVEDTTAFSAEHLVRLSTLLTGLHEVPGVVERLNAALTAPEIEWYDFARIANVLLTSGDRATAEDIRRLAAVRSPRHQTEAATILCQHDHADLGRSLILNILARGDWMDVASELLSDDILGNIEMGLTDDLLATVTDALPNMSGYQIVGVSEGLAKVGRTEDAVAAARRGVRTNVDNALLENAVEQWLAVGGSAAADEILAEVLSHDIRADYRLEVADTFAKEGLLDAAVAMWLDIVRHHGDAITQGLEAASRLVRCGYRQKTISVLDDALTDGRLANPTRSGMRALRAWVSA